jgi:hypothetical protein
MKKKIIIISLSFLIVTISNLSAQIENNNSFEKGSILVLNEVNYENYVDYKKDASIPKKESISIIKSPLEFNVYQLSQKEYDPLIIGIVQNNYNNKDINSPITEGIGFVKYNNENGIIRKGDLVTSSNIRGEAMKATKSGIILGIALEDSKGSSGLLKIRVMIQYVHF